MSVRFTSRKALFILYNALTLLVAVSMLGANVPAAQARGELSTTVDTKALAFALCTDSGRGSLKAHGNSSFVSTEKGKPIRVDPSLKKGSAEQAAQGFLAQCGSELSAQRQAADSASGFVPARQNTSQNGKRTSVKFQQTYNGIPVLAGESFVQLDENNDVVAAGGKTLSDLNIDTTPSLDPAAAQVDAVNHTAAKYGLDASLLTASEPQLWIYNPGLLTPNDGPTILVWRVDVSVADGSQPINEFTLVDAHTGDIALSFNGVDFVYEFVMYDANNTVPTVTPTPICHSLDLDGSKVIDSGPEDTIADCNNLSAAGGSTQTQQGQANLQVAYNYFLDVFGQDGPLHGNSSGGTVSSGNVIKMYVKYGAGTNSSNTYYDQNNGELLFSNGYESYLDVVGHEYSHIMINSTTPLFPYYQSGAIAESMADIFGESLSHNPNIFGSGSSTLDYKIGNTGSPIRDMSNPSVKTMTDLATYFTNTSAATCTGTRDGSSYFDTCDNGGIHTINGVSNYLAYNLLNSYGWPQERLASIYGNALSQYLTSGSDYTDLAIALDTACADMVGDEIYINYGSSAFQEIVNSGMCTELSAQISAREMYGEPSQSSGGSPDAVYCDTSTDAANALFSDDMESSAANWSVSPSGTWARTVGNASSGDYSMYADDRLTTAGTNSTLTMASGVLIPSALSNAYLYFKHYYAFDGTGAGGSSYDGGILQYSTDGGATWNQVSSSNGFTNITNGYNGVIDAGTGTNLLASLQAFVGESRGYVGTRVDIASLKGQTVKFRWTMGLDSTGTDKGWYVDDVSIYYCVANTTVYKTIFYKSTNTQDGWVLESGEFSNKGGSANSVATYLFLGDDFLDRQYRAIVSFGTAGLPDTAVVSDAYLCLRKYNLVGNNNPFNWGGGLVADIKKGIFGTSLVVPADFQSAATATTAATFGSSAVSSGSYCGSGTNWYKSAFVPADLAYINLTGVTQFRLRYVNGDNDDMNNDYLRFYSGETVYAPRIYVTFYCTTKVTGCP